MQVYWPVWGFGKECQGGACVVLWVESSCDMASCADSQECRECCGGMGFLAANKIGPMLNDMNVDVTFEGDNTVMMQQVAKSLIDVGMKKKAPPPVLPSSVRHENWTGVS
eukprot:jgi/Picre1/29985/NNA_005361.t1